MICYLPFVLVMITVPLYSEIVTTKSMTYSMGKEPSLQSICGCNVLLPGNGYNYVLASKGDAGGNCFATLVIGQTSKLTCKICVILEELSLVADVMNMTFTGEAESVLLKFGQANFTETCFEGGRLDILVVEDDEYAKKNANGEKANNGYDFKFVLEPKCSDQPIILSTVPSNPPSNNDKMTATVPSNPPSNNDKMTATVPSNPPSNNDKMTATVPSNSPSNNDKMTEPNTMDKFNMAFTVINCVSLLVLVLSVFYIYKRNQRNSTERDQQMKVYGNQEGDHQKRKLLRDGQNDQPGGSNSN